jgi:arylsulfatase A-like enzyme
MNDEPTCWSGNPHWLRRTGRCLLVLAALLSLHACSSPETTSEIQIDLLRLFPYTDSGQQLRDLDLGTPAAHVHLRRGWSPPETLPTGERVVWAAARRAQLFFTLRDRAPRRLVVRCGITSSALRPARNVIVRLNDRMIGKLRLQEGWQEHALDLPERTQRPGRNILEFFHARYKKRGPRGGRRLPRLVAYDWLRVEGKDGAVDRGSFLSADRTMAVIPAGSRVDYYVRIPAAAELLFDLQPSARAQARLRVTLSGDNRPDETLFTGTQSAVRLDLSPYAEEMVQLSLAAEGTGEVRVARPRILGQKRTEPARQRGTADTPGHRRNVLLYVIDTLRADHLGCYGYPRPTSPHIDALAVEGTLFTRTVAQASWTRPATASILTGLYPYDHGTLTLRDPLAPEFTTLAEVLQGAGYDTAAFITNVNVNGRLGFKQGFAHFVYLREKTKRPSVHVLSDEVNHRVFPWLREHRDRPFFLYVHVTDPHAPYTPPATLLERFAVPGPIPELFDRKVLQRLRANEDVATPANIAHLVARYDGEIAFVDESFGRLVAELKRLALYENTVIVVMSDHGEEFFEHGRFEHGHTLYEEQLLVPLIARFPDTRFTERRVPILARQIDIMPTLLDYVGVAVPEGIQGRSLLPWAAGADPLEDAEAFAHTSLGRRQIEAVVTGRWKVIRSGGRRGETIEVYDLQDDPREQTNQAAQRPVLAGYAQQAATASAASLHGGKRFQPGQFDLDPETARQLEELGYVLRDAD